MYELCESSTEYIWNFIMYTSCTTQYGDKFVVEPTTSKIVLEMVDPVLNKGYTLCLDNWYTSPALINKLFQRKTSCIGTVILNDIGVPEKVKVAKLKKCESLFAFRRKEMVKKRKNKKDVALVSAIHSDHMVSVQTRKGEIIKPAVVMN
jgi:hypothetical protein